MADGPDSLTVAGVAGSLQIHYEIHHPAHHEHNAVGDRHDAVRDVGQGVGHDAVRDVGQDVAGDPAGDESDASPADIPILLVHGFASNSQLNWADTGWLRSIMEAGRSAITVDLRGHGRSTQSHASGDYSPALLAADLVRVMDASGADTVDVIAYSMGCRVALALAEEAPGRVRRLVLGGVGTRELFASWDPEAVERFLVHGEPVDDPLVQSTITIATSVPANDPMALLACIRGMAGPPIEERVPVPTLVVAGERDEVAADAAVLAERIGGSFVPVRKRHHFTTVSSRVFKEAALAFLAER